MIANMRENIQVCTTFLDDWKNYHRTLLTKDLDECKVGNELQFEIWVY